MGSRTEESHPPAGAGNVMPFAAFNALSFQMIIGSPMILYAKSLDASATTLGIIAGMLPILVVFQIPAARFVDAAGYKRFVVNGWSVRTIFVGLMALVPLSAGFLPPASRLALVLLLLFCFNLSRGISTTGWLPWIASIIPAKRRGHFLTREALMVNAASFAAFWLAALILGGDPAPWRFSCLFLFSAACATVSLVFLRRIPAESRIENRMRPPRPRLPEMLRIRPFRRLLLMNVAWALGCGGVVTFLVTWLKSEREMPEQRILMLTSLVFVGALVIQFLMGRVIDRFGSRPLSMSGMLLWFGLLGTWTMIAGGLLTPNAAIFGVLMMGLGVASSMVNLSNVRLAMLAAPDEGRSHYFAVFSVVSSVSLGLAPVMWGVLLDGAAGLSQNWSGSFELNAWSLLFGILSLVFAAAFVFALRLDEPRSVRWEALMRFALRRSRVRYWIRFWARATPRM